MWIVPAKPTGKDAFGIPEEKAAIPIKSEAHGIIKGPTTGILCFVEK